MPYFYPLLYPLLCPLLYPLLCPLLYRLPVKSSRCSNLVEIMVWSDPLNEYW